MAPTASAATLQTNLAGRPIHADTLDWCSGIAYGKVNNQMVLFTAHHCRPGAAGTVVYASTGQRLGIWGENSAGTPWDLGWIYLDSGNWPSSPYLIYRGDCSDGSCPGGSTSSYWTVDSKRGTSNYSCANVGARVGDLVGQNWRKTQTTTTRYVSGLVNNIVNTCSMNTTIRSHCLPATQYKDSGSGLVATYGSMVGEVVGIASLENGEHCTGGTLIFTNFYEAIRAVDSYYMAGAWLCTASGGSACN